MKGFLLRRVITLKQEENRLSVEIKNLDPFYSSLSMLNVGHHF